MAYAASRNIVITESVKGQGMEGSEAAQAASSRVEALQSLPQRHHLPCRRVESAAALVHACSRRRGAWPCCTALLLLRLPQRIPAPASLAQPQRMPRIAQPKVAADEVHGRVVGAGAEQQLICLYRFGLQAAGAWGLREACPAE